MPSYARHTYLALALCSSLAGCLPARHMSLSVKQATRLIDVSRGLHKIQFLRIV
ncbi:hypothetical protein BD311DRAFT_753593 [Dichomitus squalens]|uniref:Uncharacterized protein n=1 Tax=Dichomitus squalens TaxID=114155 RepID=A0A4Q9MSZ2_9APHY|nr:hypothetical protein BD311DRAFT_753593 [Dichomitus squalens]